MTTAPYEGQIPEFTQADRLRKARNLTGLRVPEFAATIGVSPKTINNAESGKHSVRKVVLNQWSLVTGVPLVWLQTGIAPESDGPEGDGLTLPRLDSNQQPADVPFAQVRALRLAA